jgi:hypothetical protein
MKFATFVPLGVLLLASFVPIQAAEPAGASQVVLAFSGGSVYTADGGICMWYPVVVGDLGPKSLFARDPSGQPVVDRAHAYLVWVSDFSGAPLPDNGPFSLMFVNAGTATIYHTTRPDTRDWSDLTKRSTWGEPVARFVRKAGLFQSLDGGNSGTFPSTAVLVSSKSFQLSGKTFDFKDLMPQGMTCFESGVDNAGHTGDSEVGTCVAVGDSQSTGRGRYSGDGR